MKDKIAIEKEIEKLLETSAYIEFAVANTIVQIKYKVKELNDNLVFGSDEDLDGFQLFDSLINYLERIVDNINTSKDTLMWVVDEDKEVNE